MNRSGGTANPSDTPITGRKTGFRNVTHPAFRKTEEDDPLMDRLLTLLRLYPNVVRFRAEDLSGMDTETKTELIAQFTEVLGLDVPAKEMIPL